MLWPAWDTSAGDTLLDCRMWPRATATFKVLDQEGKIVQGIEMKTERPNTKKNMRGIG